MDNQLPAEWVLPADKVVFIKEAIQKLKASNRSDYESGEFDSFNHKQEGRYRAYEEMLQWISPSITNAVLERCTQADKARVLLEKFISRHEAGLLPDRFIYDEIKTFLDGTK